MIECYNRDCPFHCGDEPFCYEVQCHQPKSLKHEFDMVAEREDI